MFTTLASVAIKISWYQDACKKRKSSLGRKTAKAKKVNQTRLNEDDETYSQRLEVVKEKRAIPRKNV